MAELSPAAQAVLDAYGTCDSTYEAQVNTLNTGGQRLAAALRAAADQVVPENRFGPPENAAAAQREITRAELFALAAELEA